MCLLCRFGFKWMRSPTEKAIDASLGIAYKLYQIEKDRKNIMNKYGVWCVRVRHGAARNMSCRHVDPTPSPMRDGGAF